MRPRVKQIGSSEARQLVEPPWVRIGVHKDNRRLTRPARNSVMSFSIIAASQDDWVPTQIYQALRLDNRRYLGIGAHQHSRLAELSRGRPSVSATLTTAALIASAVARDQHLIADPEGPSSISRTGARRQYSRRRS